MTAAKKAEELERVALARPTVVYVEGVAQVDKPTHDLLLTLGWTPPAAV